MRGRDGRFIKKVEAVRERPAVEVDENEHPPMPPAPEPARCRTYTRARVAEALPSILSAFLKHAQNGSVAHMKALTALGGIDKGEVEPESADPVEKTIEVLVLEQWRNGPGRYAVPFNEEAEGEGIARISDSSDGSEEDADGD